MTTIAVDRKSMSCDSRSSYDDGEYFTCDDKVERIGKSLVGCAGSHENISKFIEWFRDQSKDRPDFGDDPMTAVELTKDGIYVYSSTTYRSKVRDPFFAVGSGSMAARAAMLCGKTPAEAVAIAIKCDKNSGGTVRTYQLADT